MDRTLRTTDSRDLRLKRTLSVGRQATIVARPCSSMVQYRKVAVCTEWIVS